LKRRKQSITSNQKQKQLYSKRLNSLLHESWPKKYYFIGIIAIIFLSLFVRILYFVDLKDSPAVAFHRWSESDMNFFDLWANKIANGDFLIKEPLHPDHSWYKLIADYYFSENPDKLEEFKLKALQTGRVGSESEILWDHWYGGNRFQQEPFYPYFIGISYKFLSKDVRWIFAFQLVLGTVTTLLLFFVTRRLFGDTAGALSALLAIFCAPLLFYEFVLLRASFIVFFSIFFVYLIQVTVESQRQIYWLILGLALGVSLLIKTTFIVYILCLFIFLVSQYFRNNKNILSYFIFVLIGIFISISPLVIRNLLVGTPAFGFSSVASVLFITPNIKNASIGLSGYHIYLNSVADIFGLTDGKLISTIIETLKTHGSPISYLKLLYDKLILIFHWYEAPNNVSFYYFRLISSTLGSLPIQFIHIAPFALIGLIFAIRTIEKSWPLYVSVLTGFLPMIIFLYLSRFRAPLLVTFIPFAAFCIVDLCDKMNRRQYSAFFVIFVIITLFLFISRPLEQNVSKFRFTDFNVAFHSFYKPKLIEYNKTGNWSKAASLMEKILKTKPKILNELRLDAQPKSINDKQLSQIFARYHLQYSIFLKKLNRHEEALNHQRLAAELLKRAG
jgi:4-amino-4-deoxy-L-arabinose transferase-like glycosyltransferase